MPALQFANLRVYRESHDLAPLLYVVFMEFIEHCWPDEAKPVRVVCIHRTLEEEIAAGGKSGIHALSPPYRAIDIGGREFTQAQIDAAAAKINAGWCYDPARPGKLVCFAEPHGTGPHFHLQVHPNTARRP